MTYRQVMILSVTVVVILLVTQRAWSDTTVTIYNEFLSQGGRLHYEVDRWNKLNGLTNTNLIQKCQALRTEAGRWLNRDLNGHLFQNWPQSRTHHGYPDPHYLDDQTLARNTWSKYMENIQGYGRDINIVWEIKGLYWPKWMDQSHHKGHFPNNLDSAAEFIALMVQGAKDYSKGHIPPYFEVINEPNAAWQYLDSNTILEFHKAVAQKVKSRFGIKVGGPTYTGSYLLQFPDNSFKKWHDTAKFMDMSLEHMDFFSFHAYNHLYVNGGSHHFTGINEARLVAAVDMIENYSHQKKGESVPLIVSEYGRGAIHGTNPTGHSEIVDFATVFHSTAHLFTYLNLREFMDRAVVFLHASDPKNWNLFDSHGHETKIVNHFKFWHHIDYDHKFMRLSSRYDGLERVVSPLVFGNPKTQEVLVLLVNHGTSWQNVHLDFHGGWINPTTGQSTCMMYQNGVFQMHSNVHFDVSKNHGKVGIAGEAVCMYSFKSTSFNLNSLHTTTENTFYGKDMVIPIQNGHAQTSVHLPSSGYHTARIRIGVDVGKGQTAKPKSVSINGHVLTSGFAWYDAEKTNGDTLWQSWEYAVPESSLTTANTISMTFNGSGGHVTSVALAVGKIQ